jgi:hypothetical protein
MITVKIMTGLDSKPTKSDGHFEENKFSVGGHQFLSDCCPKLIKTYNLGQNAVNVRQFKNKNKQYCAVRLFNFEVAETFCRFSVYDCRYFFTVIV